MKKIFALLMLFSVLNIYSQDEFRKNIFGRWKLEQTHQKTAFLNFGEYLKISDNEIHFYNLINGNKANEIVKKFHYINHTEEYIDKNRYQLIKFENGEIWELRLRIINNETRLIFKLKVDEEGNHWFATDDRGIIKDPEKRKKALEGEINTYYVKCN